MGAYSTATDAPTREVRVEDVEPGQRVRLGCGVERVVAHTDYDTREAWLVFEPRYWVVGDPNTRTYDRGELVDVVVGEEE